MGVLPRGSNSACCAFVPAYCGLFVRGFTYGDARVAFLAVHVIADIVDLLFEGFSKLSFEKGPADGEGPRSRILDFVKALIAVDAAGKADRGIDSLNERLVEGGCIPGVSVSKKIESVDTLFQCLLRFGNHVFESSFKNGRSSGDGSYERHVLQAMFLAQFVNRIGIHCAKKHVNAALYRRICSSKTLLFIVGNDFEKRGFPHSFMME